ncbi:unnamed protein product [Blepharisma stoltei]|uniref:C2H2-type domain-containing protein n=1 Tax=Blepharisma stoltei TaxID=1481888 RepID=A0AAU9JK85_9CILI|nr:unnamed protein product [Blepharisma stoltei]
MGVCSCTERDEATKIQNKPKDEYLKNMQKIRKAKNDEDSDDDLKRSKTEKSAVSALLDGIKEGDTFKFGDGSEYKVVMFISPPRSVIIKCLICEVSFPDIELNWHIKNPEHIMNCSEKCVIF